MKKTFSLLAAAALLLIAVPSFAQIHIGAGYVNSADRIRVSSGTETEATVTYSNGVYAGLGFTLPLVGDLALTPGVYYTYLTNRNASSVAGGLLSLAGERQEHYVSVPLHFNYGDELFPNFRLFFFAGPTVSAGLASKTTVSGSILGFSANTVVDNYKDVSGYGRWDVLLGGGMGFDFARRLRLTVGYDFGMLNRYTDGNAYTRHRQQLHAGLAFLF